MEKNPDETVDEWEIDNLPNRLTLFRMALIPLMIVPLWLLSEFKWAQNYHLLLGHLAGWTFVAASITDFFDGYIARKRNIVTVFGSFLDPIADKFLVVSALIMLMALERVHFVIVIVLILREIYITALRLLAYQKGLKLPVEKMGKWKTAVQMVAIPLLMAYDRRIPYLSMPVLGQILIWPACFLSIFSAFQYSFGLLKKLRQKRDAFLNSSKE